MQKDESQNEATFKLIKETKAETSKFREQFEKNWREYEDAYYGKQHKTGENYKTVKNHIFKIIEGEVPILTDSMPGTSVLADTESRQDDAVLLEKSIKFVYQDQNLQLLLPSLVRSMLTSAPGFLYPYYDPDAAGGEGKVRIKKISWDGVFLDGNASLIEDANKAVIEHQMRRDELARTFPHKKDQILGIQSDQDIETNADDDNFEKRDVSSSGKTVAGRPKKNKAKDVVTYTETWIKSYDLEKIPQEETIEELQEEQAQIMSGNAPDIFKWEDHDAHLKGHRELADQILAKLGLPPGTEFEQAMQMVDALQQQNPEADFSQLLLSLKLAENHIEEHESLKELNPTSERPKYPDGWRLIKSVEKIILFDGPNPENNGEINLVPFYCYKDDTIYGFGEVKNIIDPQRTLNEMDYKEYKGLKVCANPGWIADHESGVSDKNLTNDDGIVVIKAKGTEVRRLEAGTISPQLERRIINDIDSMEDISGINESSQGRTPSPNASGAAINALQNQSIGRIRLKDRYLNHYSMKRLAKLVAGLIINNWSTEKKLRLSTDSSGNQEFVFDPIKVSDLNYTIDIAPGSMAGIDKESLNALYFRLLDSQQIPFKDFLMVADFPKKEILLKNLEEREKLQNEQEQLVEQVKIDQQATDEELVAIKKENIKLKARIDPNLLTPEEQSLFKDVIRQEAVEALTGNLRANNGQLNNQGN